MFLSLRKTARCELNLPSMFTSVKVEQDGLWRYWSLYCAYGMLKLYKWTKLHIWFFNRPINIHVHHDWLYIYLHIDIYIYISIYIYIFRYIDIWILVSEAEGHIERHRAEWGGRSRCSEGLGVGVGAMAALCECEWVEITKLLQLLLQAEAEC